MDVEALFGRQGTSMIYGDYHGESDLWRRRELDVADEAVGRQLHIVNRAIDHAIAEALAPTRALHELEERVSALESVGDTVVLPIYECPGYRLRAPISVILEPIEGGVIARIPELDLWVDAESHGTAIEELKESLSSLIVDLAESNEQSLGVLPRAWRSLVDRLAEKL